MLSKILNIIGDTILVLLQLVVGIIFCCYGLGMGILLIVIAIVDVIVLPISFLLERKGDSSNG